MRRLLIILGALSLLAACGEKDVGADCSGGAAMNDCVDGAVCTAERSATTAPPESPNGDRFVCRTICDIDANCSDGFDCRVASGTMYRTCQPTDDALPGADAGAME